jgi:membrane fusion protein (multidrug efflux system)
MTPRARTAHRAPHENDMSTINGVRCHSFRVVGAVAMSIGLAACPGNAPPAAVGEQAAAPGPPTIEVAHVLEQPVQTTLSLPGELNPYQVVAIYPRVTGFVKTIAVDRGSRVRAGDLLVVLEAPELAAQRSEAQSKLQSAQAQLGAVRAKADADASTAERLHAAAATPGVVAGNDVMLAQKTVEADQGQIAAALQNIEAARQALNAVSEIEGYLRVTAPFPGVVTERNVHPGAFVGPSSGPGAATPLVRLIDNDRLRLVVPVPEAYTAGMTMGTKMPFTVAAYPGQTFSGTMARIAHAVDVNTRTMAVELDVINSDGRLAPGTFCQVRWPVRRTALSLLVPSASVASTTGRTFVVRVTNGRTEWVDVKTGLAAGPLVEVFGGEAIAARGSDEIRAGIDVLVKERPPAAS